MILRALRASDAEAAASIHAQAFDEAWSAADLAGFLTGLGGFGFAVAGGEGLAGFILCRLVADQAEVLTLATAPDHRRQGVAAALIQAAVAAAGAGGAKSLFLEVAADNAAALALYGAADFTAVGRRAGYYQRPAGAVDALVLRRAP